MPHRHRCAEVNDRIHVKCLVQIKKDLGDSRQILQNRHSGTESQAVYSFIP